MEIIKVNSHRADVAQVESTAVYSSRQVHEILHLIHMKLTCSADYNICRMSLSVVDFYCGFRPFKAGVKSAVTHADLWRIRLWFVYLPLYKAL